MPTDDQLRKTFRRAVTHTKLQYQELVNHDKNLAIQEVLWALNEFKALHNELIAMTFPKLKVLSKEDRGKYQGPCSRRGCLTRPAEWYNPHTKQYVCEVCAHQQNAELRREGLELCFHRD